MLTTPDVLVDAGSMAGNITSSSQQLTNIFGYSVQAVYTGSPVGTIKLQASLDRTTWNDVSNSSTAISAAGSTLWNISDVQYPYLRVVYTRDSGSGVLTVKFFGKGF